MDLVDHQQRAEVQRQKLFFLWALDENVTTESWKKRERDVFSRAKLEHVEEDDLAEQIWFRGGSVMWGFSWRNEPLMILSGIQSDWQQKTRRDAAVQITQRRSKSQLSCSWRHSIILYNFPHSFHPPDRKSVTPPWGFLHSVWLHHRTGERLVQGMKTQEYQLSLKIYTFAYYEWMIQHENYITWKSHIRKITKQVKRPTLMETMINWYDEIFWFLWRFICKLKKIK